jgi:hypothetical protein
MEARRWEGAKGGRRDGGKEGRRDGKEKGYEIEMRPGV